MRAVAQIDAKQISDMELDITFRMKVSEWQEVMRQMPVEKWPSHIIARQVAGVLGHIRKATGFTYVDPPGEADKTS